MSYYITKTTAKAPIASFSDGADDVPTKSLVVTIPPTLSGVSAVNETQIPSRNMASMSDADFILNNVLYYTNNGVLYIDGTSTGETSSSNDAFKVLDFWLPSGTYYFSRGTTLTSLNVATYLRKYDDKTEIKANQGSFTLSEKTHLYLSFYVYTKTFSNIKADICINLGSTAITYEDTTPITQYTASLGRTIYGGQADIVNGVGTDENGNEFTFDGQEIPTRLGYNAFWSDEGDTEVTYYCKVESEELYTVTDTTLKNIADAIRTKTERTAPIFVEDMDDEILSIVTGGGGGAECDRLFFAQGYDNWQVEIPTITSLIQDEKYSEYVSYDTTTKKFTALKDFTAVIVAWVYTYQTYEASRSDGAFYVNSTKLAQYEATGNVAGSVGGVRLIYNLKQGDTFYPYTPTTDGYPRQYCKVYAISDIDDDVFTYTNEEAT